MIICKVQNYFDSVEHKEELKLVNKLFVEHPEVAFGFLAAYCIERYGYKTVIETINDYLY